jgi:hypothetical protein
VSEAKRGLEGRSGQSRRFARDSLALFAGRLVRRHQFMTLARLEYGSRRRRMWRDLGKDEPTFVVFPEHDVCDLGPPASAATIRGSRTRRPFCI